MPPMGFQGKIFLVTIRKELGCNFARGAVVVLTEFLLNPEDANS